MLSLLLFLLVAFLGAYYYFKHKEEFHLITSIDYRALIAISSLIIINSLSYALQLKVLLDHYHLNADFFQCYVITCVSHVMNLFLPIGGSTSLKALYLKKTYQFKYSSFIASMGIANVIKIIVNALFALLILVLSSKTRSSLLTAISGVMFSASVLFLYMGHKVSIFDFTRYGYLKNLLNEWWKLRNDHPTVMKLVFITTLIFLITSFRLYFSFLAFSAPVSAITSSLISAFSIITGALNLVPGNIGIKEAIVVYLSAIQGIEVNDSVHAAALDRVLTTAWTFIISMYISVKNRKKEIR